MPNRNSPPHDRPPGIAWVRQVYGRREFRYRYSPVHIYEDFSQANDLAKENPEKLRQMEDLWWVETAKHNVLPLDWRAVERLQLKE